MEIGLDWRDRDSVLAVGWCWGRAHRRHDHQLRVALAEHAHDTARAAWDPASTEHTATTAVASVDFPAIETGSLGGHRGYPLDRRPYGLGEARP
jgi:hypothetical protein